MRVIQVLFLFRTRKDYLTLESPIMICSYRLIPNISPIFRNVYKMSILKARMNRLGCVKILFVMVLTVLMGCSASNYGRLTSNSEVTQAFQTHQVLPDHTYYYRGTFSRPFVIAGIHKKFTLDSPLWIEIDPKSNDFRTLIDRVGLQGSGRTIEPWGFSIIDKSGREVGVWYSAIRAAAVEVDENGRIINLAPLRTVTRGDQGR